LFKASYSSYEINPLGPSEILDIEYWSKYLICKDCYIQYPDRVTVGISSFPCCKAVPDSVEVHRKVMKPFWLIYLRSFFPGLEGFFQRCKKFFGSEAVEVFDWPVIINYSQLVSGKMHCKEIIILLITLMLRILPLLFLSHKCSRSCSVMTVSNIG